MSNRERCIELLDRLDEDALCMVVAYLEKIDEDLDMEFCLALAREADEDLDQETVTFDECLAELGLTYDDLQD